MYSALIVEDETLVRHGIKSMLDWAAAGIDTVYEASNGMEALDVYAQNRPDIIMTDLKMPVMDGITLIKTVREREADTRTRFVVMSCLDEFSLVQQALNFGVSHYFLKVTASCGDIQAVLGRITRELREASRQESNGALGRAEVFFQSLLEGLRVSEGEAAAVLAALGHDPDEPYALAVLRAARREGEIAPLPAAQTLAQAVIGLPGIAPAPLRLLPGQYALLLTQAQARAFIPAAGTQAEQSRESVMRVQAGLSRLARGPGQLAGALRQAVHALDGCFFTGADRAQWEGQDGFAVPSAHTDRLVSLPSGFMHLPGSFIDAYEARIRQLAQQRYATPDAFRNALSTVVVWLSVQADCAVDSLESASASCMRSISQGRTLLELVASFEQFVLETLGLSSFSEKMPDSITSALLYINANLDQPLTLNEIAGHTHLNPSYLSTLFHKVMRLNLVTYINSLRIEKAKAMLRNTELPVSQIALAVGFSQDIYFYRLFKRIAGQTPSEYRNEFHADFNR